MDITEGIKADILKALKGGFTAVLQLQAALAAKGMSQADIMSAFEQGDTALKAQRKADAEAAEATRGNAKAFMANAGIELPEQFGHLSSWFEGQGFAPRSHFVVFGRIDENGKAQVGVHVKPKTVKGAIMQPDGTVKAPAKRGDLSPLCRNQNDTGSDEDDTDGED